MATFFKFWRKIKCCEICRLGVDQVRATFQHLSMCVTLKKHKGSKSNVVVSLVLQRDLYNCVHWWKAALFKDFIALSVEYILADCHVLVQLIYVHVYIFLRPEGLAFADETFFIVEVWTIFTASSILGWSLSDRLAYPTIINIDLRRFVHVNGRNGL